MKYYAQWDGSGMDLSKVLSELRRELEYIDAAILSLEHLQAVPVRRRGRPPKLLSDLNRATPPSSDRESGTPRGQRRQSSEA